MLKSTDSSSLEEALTRETIVPEGPDSVKNKKKDKSLEEAITSIEEETSLNDDPSSVLAKNNELTVQLGLSDDALNEAIEYMGGTAGLPKFAEGFSIDKLKNFTTVATVAQVSRVPGLIKLLNETNSYLFASTEIQKMDMTKLTNLSKSLSEEIRLILDSARKTLDTLDKLDAPISANQQLLDQLLQMPDDEIKAMKDYIAGKKNSQG